MGFSGGGYRSMLTCAGVLAAFDERVGYSLAPNTSYKNSASGILQATSYIVGISGGSWLVMSNLINDFQPIDQSIISKTWALHERLLEGVPDFDPEVLIRQTSNESQTENRGDFPELEKNGIIQSVLKWLGLSHVESFFISKSYKTDISSDVMKKFVNTISRTKNSESVDEEKAINSWIRASKYYKELNIEVRSKRSAGFYLSLTDYWGRALARRIFNTAARAPGATISDCISLPSFKNHDQPFPIICTIQKEPNSKTTNLNSHIFEFSPYEFGSWDSYLNSFVKIKYLGTKLYDGRPVIEKSGKAPTCISGFDNIGFITATSSSLFNHLFFHLYRILVTIESEAFSAIDTILRAFGLSSKFKSLKYPQQHPDYALYSPNPFHGYYGSLKSYSKIPESPHLYFVDGGDDGQNIPFQALLQKSRKLDLIFVVDVTSDKMNYPNGTCLWKTKQRFHNPSALFTLPTFITPSLEYEGRENLGKIRIDQRSVFPYVPSTESFTKLGLNGRPLFLGCDIRRDYPVLQSNLTESSSSKPISDRRYLPPLIIYYPNYNYTFQSNTSTFKLSYTDEEATLMIKNGYHMATNMNSKEFSKCLSCAIMKREFDRQDIFHSNKIKSKTVQQIPRFCKKCFNTFCWTPDKTEKPF